MRHHQRVSIMSLGLGQAAGLGQDALFDLFKAAIIHDAGAVTWQEKLALENFDTANPWPHCRQGYQLTSGIPTFESVAETILSHHDHWVGGNPSGLSRSEIPLSSRIIHLVDRVDVLIRDEVYILEQRREILQRIRNLSGQIFDPDLVDLFSDLTRNEGFWLNLVSPWTYNSLLQLVPFRWIRVTSERLLELAELFARVVDAKSPFTYRHSCGVAATAKFLAQKAGLPPKEWALLEVAGLLHDLGKLAVPEEIIEKPGALTRTEMNLVKQHTYHTYWVLKPMLAKYPLAEWAAFHHERLDGRGYPFRKVKNELDVSSRIMAVADIYTALREDRPYRQGLTWTELEGVIRKKVLSGALDPELADLLFENRRDLDESWAELTYGKRADHRPLAAKINWQ
ncbi:MAG: HD domain-containing protein [Syntrophomonadaceae bacterium]|nr:HD domain-containing protein [Syntrophomonadaceae bacterium]